MNQQDTVITYLPDEIQKILKVKFFNPLVPDVH